MIALIYNLSLHPFFYDCIHFISFHFIHRARGPWTVDSPRRVLSSVEFSIELPSSANRVRLRQTDAVVL